MFQEMVANYFKVAESAIQFQHELLRQWSGQWPTAAIADGRTEQVRALQKKASEDSSEMLNLQRKLLAIVTKPENRLIEDVPRMAKAAALPDRHGDVDAQTAVPGGATTAPNGLPASAEAAARAFRTGEDATIVLREEELHALKRLVETGEVRKEEMRVVRVEQEQNVDMHAAPAWDTIIADGEKAGVLHQAYLKWLAEGCPEGQDRRHYFEALQQVR